MEARVDPRGSDRRNSGAIVYRLKGTETDKTLSKEPEQPSELDKVIEKMKKECDEREKIREEAEKKRMDEAYKRTIEKIFKAVCAGKSDKARRILEEFVEKEGVKIATDLNSKRRRSRYVHDGRPSQTIFFRQGN